MDKKNPNKTFKRPVDDKEDVVLSKGYFHFEVSQEEVAQAVKVMKERDFNNDIHWFDEKDEEVEPEQHAVILVQILVQKLHCMVGRQRKQNPQNPQMKN